MLKNISIGLLCLLIILTFACKKSNTTLLQLNNAPDIGVDFINQINESDTFNVLTFANIYNGSGIAIADFNGDSLPDLFFGGNMVSSRLYLNQSKNGRLIFVDITEQANIYTNRWVSGVNVADINQDGLMDIYLSVTGPENANKQNYLFINQGVNSNNLPTFNEEASYYNLNDSSSTTQSAFLDYDRDGDLDLFMIVNKAENYYGGIEPTIKVDLSGNERERTDRLYRNNFVECQKGLHCEEKFSDVSYAAGIIFPGYSLGLAVGDLNNDGWSDIYVANDFVSNDLLYINNQDGTFINQASESLTHTSFSGMGIDIGDLNNDGLLDIVEVDMIPESDKRLKSMWSAINYDKFKLTISAGYAPQFSRNTLQLNQGIINGYPMFSDIGYLAGLHYTDWSWSVLFSDLNLDGLNDIFIANGYQRDMQDLDFVHYMQKPTSYFGAESNQQFFLNSVRNLPAVKVPNYTFKNNGDLTFDKSTREWIGEIPSISHGAAIADLDNDGDQDLIICNNNDFPFIYQNSLNSYNAINKNYCKIRLRGSAYNRQAIGARVVAYANKLQVLENNFVHGFQSAAATDLIIALENANVLDSIKIIWPDGKVQKEYNLLSNQINQIVYKEESQELLVQDTSKTIFEKTELIDFEHKEYDFVDFHYQRLVPKKYSQNGPALAAGDLSGNGLDDIVMGGSKDFPTMIFFQNNDGKFKGSMLPGSEKFEDQGILLLDIDNDGDNDLYIGSGGIEYGYSSEFYQDRIYLNNGKGIFSLQQSLNQSNSSVVTGADFDKDGHLDLFVGGGVLPGRYPFSENSKILKNTAATSDSVFSNYLNLDSLGIVSAALWTDVNNDSWIDLIIVGEWMPITILINNYGKNFVKKELKDTQGWWNSVNGGDFDNDGDIDYIIGNIGLNSKYKADKDHPVKVYVHDFDNNGSLDPVITQYNQKNEVLVHPRDELIEQMPQLRKQLYNYADYAELDVKAFFEFFNAKDPASLQVKMLSSIILINQGNIDFEVIILPNQVQVSPILGTVVADVNKDQLLDLIISGNSYAADLDVGYYDASYGQILLNQNENKWLPVSNVDDGFLLNGDAKALIEISLSNDTYLISSSNRDKIKSYKLRTKADKIIKVEADDAYALIELANNQIRKQEFYHGSSYYSQSARFLRVDDYMKSITIVKYNGNRRRLSQNLTF